MLNLKKGLALVLAAATAFTFAPVANLGNAVSAQADEAHDKSITEDAKAAGGNEVTNGKEVELNLGTGTYVLSFPKKSDGTVNTASGKVRETSSSVAKKKDGTTAALTSGVTTDTTFGVVDDSAKLKLKLSDATANGEYTFTITKVRKEQTVISGAADFPNYDIINENQEQWTIKLTVKGLAAPSVSTALAQNATRPDSEAVATDFPKTVFGDKIYHIQKGQTITLADLKAFNDAPTPTDVTSSVGHAKKFAFRVTSESGRITVADNGTITGSLKTGDFIKDGKAKITGIAGGGDKLKVEVYALKATDISDDVFNTTKRTYKKGEVVTSAEFSFVVDDPTSNISAFTWNQADGKIGYPSAAYRPAGYKDSQVNQTSIIRLDTKVAKSLQLNVTAAGALTYISSDTSVATVSNTGLIEAKKAGQTTVRVLAAPTASINQLGDISLTVIVSQTSKDVITAEVDGKDVNLANDPDAKIDLDPSTSTSSVKVNSKQITAKSVAGLTPLYQLVDAEGSTAYGNSAIATVDSTGKVTAGTKTGTVYVRITTAGADSVAAADPVYVKVVVNTLPQADITNVPDTVRLDLNQNKTYTFDPKSSVANVVWGYTPDDDASTVVDLTGSKITAKKLGYGKITVTAAATATTRQTTKNVTVAVVDNAAKADSDLKVASSALTVKVGDTASASASTTASGAAITYTSSDTDVATVAADGTITAVAPGTAVVTVKAAETDTVNAGTATIVVTVPSNPQKVTGVKVSSKRGAYVSVKWTSQGKNINYRVYKKVGNGKWVGKNVAGSKTTLSVKKGAKVQVKVKSYVKDSNGKTTWGPAATKAKTFKTDKK